MYHGLGVSKEIQLCLLFAIQQNALISRKNLQKAYNSGLFVLSSILDFWVCSVICSLSLLHRKKCPPVKIGGFSFTK